MKTVILTRSVTWRRDSVVSVAALMSPARLRASPRRGRRRDGPSSFRSALLARSRVSAKSEKNEFSLLGNLRELGTTESAGAISAGHESDRLKIENQRFENDIFDSLNPKKKHYKISMFRNNKITFSVS